MDRHERGASSPIVGKPVRAAFCGGRPACDARVLVLAGIERRLEISGRLAHRLAYPRSPKRVHHASTEMIRSRVPLAARAA